MKNIILIIVLALIIFSCKKAMNSVNIVSSGVNSDEAAAPIKQTVPIEEEIYDVCTNENVHITGSYTYTIKSVNANDYTNFTYNMHYSTTGIGETSGTKYQGTGHTTSHEHFTNTIDWLQHHVSESLNSKLQFTSQGGGTMGTTMRLHFVLDKTGQPILDTFEFLDWTCTK